LIAKSIVLLGSRGDSAQEQAVTMAMMQGEAHVEKNSQMLQKTSD